jgi:hypothetical protein
MYPDTGRYVLFLLRQRIWAGHPWQNRLDLISASSLSRPDGVARVTVVFGDPRSAVSR